MYRERNDPARPRIRTFHGRHGRGTSRRHHLLTEVAPTFALDRRPDKDRPLVVEVGCGDGAAAVAFADAHPETDIVAVDVHTPGIGAVLATLERAPRPNVFVEHGDAVDLLVSFSAGSVAGLHVFFPDPWPKARHRKRRFIREDILDIVAHVLAESAPVLVATDAGDYAAGARQQLDHHPSFAGGIGPRPAWRPATRYERRGRDAGRPITDLRYRRLYR